MGVGAIGNREAWSEFLMVARAAQSRNPALVAAAAAGRTRPAGAAAQNRFVQPPTAPAVKLQGSSSTEAQPKKYTRVLGTHFDAYA
jgi:hypothetical protein